MQLDKGLHWGNCKPKALQADLGIFTHISAYSRIFRHIQAYSGTISQIQDYSDIVRTLVYSEYWHIQKLGMIRTLAYSEPEAHSEP